MNPYKSTDWQIGLEKNRVKFRRNLWQLQIIECQYQQTFNKLFIMPPLHQPHRPDKLSLQDLEVRLLLLVLMLMKLTIKIDITTSNLLILLKL